MTHTGAIPTTHTSDRHARTAMRFLQNALGDYHPREFAVELWDGSTWPAETETPLFTVVLHHPGALRRMFLPPNELTLGEAYIFGDFSIRGQLSDVMRVRRFPCSMSKNGACASN